MNQKNTLDTLCVMDLYTQYERKIQHDIPNAERVADENIIKYIYAGSRPSFIYYYQPVTLNIDALIKREIAYFNQLKKSFEWKVYATDTPSDIGERLLAHGFIKEEIESFLVRKIKNYQPDLSTPDGLECLVVTTKQMFRDSFEIQNTEFPLDVDERVEQYWEKYQKDKNCTIYVVYSNGKAVSSARIDFTPNSIFAGLWAGTTVKEYRGNGYYQILLNYRIDEAKKRGREYVTIDALETSRSIVQKHGFQLITTTTPYVYNLK